MTAATAVTYGKHIGLAGALTLAVGIGVAVADPWTASAAPADAGVSSSTETAAHPAARTHKRVTDGRPTARRHTDRADALPGHRLLRNLETASNDTATETLSTR